MHNKLFLIKPTLSSSYILVVSNSIVRKMYQGVDRISDAWPLLALLAAEREVVIDVLKCEETKCPHLMSHRRYVL